MYLSGSPSLRTTITSAAQALALIDKGRKQRAVGRTNCNEHSSRSHAILTLHIESRISKASQRVVKLGKLHLIDLAGSERLAISGAQGSTLLETQNINLSLTTLGDVLSALSKYHATADGKAKSGNAKDKSKPLVPYRNSKLTMLLKDSLGGNSKTIMIATIRTLATYKQQTLMILMYASRAKMIKNATKINTDKAGASKASSLIKEIDLLKAQLKRRESALEELRRNGLNLSELHRLSQENAAEKKRLEACLEQVVHNHASTLAAQQQKYNALQSKLGKYEAVFHQQQQEIAVLRETVKHLSRDDDIKETRQIVEQLVSALETSRKETQSLRMKMGEVDVDRASLEEQNEALVKEKTALQHLVEEKDDEYNALRLKCANTIEQAQEEITQLLSQKDEEIKQAKAALSILQTQLNEQAKQSCDPSMEASLEAARRRIVDLEESVKRHQEKLQSQDGELDILSSKWKDAIERNEQLVDSLKGVEKKYEESEKNCQELERKWKQQRSVAEKSEVEVQALKNAIGANEKQHLAQIRKLEIVLDSAGLQSKQLLDAKEEEVSALKQAQNNLRTELSSLKTELQKSQQLHQTVKAELNGSKSKENLLGISLQKAQASYRKLQETSSQRAAKLEEDLRKERTNSLELQSLQQACERLKSELGNAKADEERQYNALKDLQKVHSELQRSFSLEIAGLQSQLEAEKAQTIKAEELQQVNRDLNASLQLSRTDRDRLEKLVGELRQAKSDLQQLFVNQISSLQDTVKTEKEKTANYENTVADLTRARETLEKLSSERLQIRKDVNSLKSSRAKALARVKSLEDQAHMVSQNLTKSINNVIETARKNTDMGIHELGLDVALPPSPTVALQDIQGANAAFSELAVFLDAIGRSYANAVRDSKESLQSRLQELETNCAQLRHSLQAEKDEVTKAKEELDRSRAQSNASAKAFHSAEARLKDDLDRLKVALSSEVQAKDSLQTQLNQHKSKVIEIENSLAVKVDELQALQAKSARELAAANADREQLKAEVSTARQQCKEREEQLREAQNKMNTLVLDNEKLQTLQTTSVTKLNRLEAEASQSSAEVSKLKEKLASLAKSKALLEESLVEKQQREMQEASAAFEADKENLERRLNAAVSQAANDLAVLEHEKVDLQSKVSATQDQLQSLKLQRESDAASISQLKSALQEVASEKSLLELAIKQTKVELQQLKSSKEREESLRNKQHKDSLQALQETETAKHSAIKQTHVEEVEKLRQDFAEELRSATDKLEQKREAEVTAAVLTTEKLQESLEKLEQQRLEETSQLEGSIRELETQMAEKEATLANRRSEIESTQADNSELIRKLEEQGKAMAIAEDQVARLEASIRSHEKRESAKLEELSEEISALKSRNKSLEDKSRECEASGLQKLEELQKATSMEKSELQAQIVSIDQQKTAEVSALQDQVARLEASMRSRETQESAKLDELSEEISVLKARNRSLEEKASESEATGRQKLEELQQATSIEKSELQAQMASIEQQKTAEVCALQQRISQLEKDLKAQVQQQEILADKSKEAFAEVASKQASERIARRLESVEKERNSLKEELESQREGLESTVESLLKEKSLLVSQHQTELKSLRIEVNKERDAQVRAIEERLNNKSRECEELQKAAEVIGESNSNDMVQLQKEIELLKVRIPHSSKATDTSDLTAIVPHKTHPYSVEAAKSTLSNLADMETSSPELSQTPNSHNVGQSTSLLSKRKSLGQQQLMDKIKVLVERSFDHSFIPQLESIDSRLCSYGVRLAGVAKMTDGLWSSKKFRRAYVKCKENPALTEEEELDLTGVREEDMSSEVASMKNTASSPTVHAPTENLNEVNRSYLKQPLVSSKDDNQSQISADVTSLAEEREKIEKLESSLQAAEESLKAMSMDKSQLESERDGHLGTIKVLKEQQNVTKTWVEDLKQQRDHLEIRLHESREEAEELFRQTELVAALQEKLKTNQEEYTSLRQQTNHLQEELKLVSLEKQKSTKLGSEIRSILEARVADALRVAEHGIMQRLEQSSTAAGSKIARLENRFESFVKQLQRQLEALRREKSLVHREKKQFRRQLTRQNEKKLEAFQRSILTKQRQAFRKELEKIRSDQQALLTLAKKKRINYLDENLPPRASRKLNKDSSSENVTAVRSQGQGRMNILNAALKGDVEALRNLLDGPSQNALKLDLTRDNSHDFLPLHRCVSGYHFHSSIDRVVACVECLSSHGADINSTDQAGNTVLHKVLQVLASDSIMPVLKLLLALGADPSVPNAAGETPLHTEIRRLRGNSLEVVKLMVESGADVNASDGEKLSPLQLVQRLAVSPEIEMEDGVTKKGLQSFWMPVLRYMQSVSERTKAEENPHARLALKTLER